MTGRQLLKILMVDLPTDALDQPFFVWNSEYGVPLEIHSVTRVRQCRNDWTEEKHGYVIKPR